MTRHVLRLVAALAWAAAFVTPAVAQLKGPPPAQPRPVVADPRPDVTRFAAAYDKAGDPRLLVLAGIDTLKPADGGGAVQEAVTSGNTQAGTHVGSRLSLFDRSGDAPAVKARIEEYLNAADVRLVSLDALAERDRREAELTAERGDSDVLQMLGTKTNADFVLVVRMQAGTGHGAAYRVWVEGLQVASGRKLTGFTFDWREGTDSDAIRHTSEAITRKFMEQFSAVYERPLGATNTFVLRIIDITDVADLRKVRNAVKGISGVKKVYDVDNQTAGPAAGRRGLATLEAKYEGSQFDFAADLQEAAAKSLGFKVNALDSSSGAITLAVTPPEKPRGMAEILMDPTDPGFAGYVKKFQAAYSQRGAPKIAVIVNREPTQKEKDEDPKLRDEMERMRLASDRDRRRERDREDDDRRQPPPATLPAGANTNVNTVTVLLAPVSLPGNRNDDRDDDRRDRDRRDREDKPNAEDNIARALDTRRVENKVFKRLVQLGVQAIDADVAREKLASRIDKEKRLYDEKELVFLLGRAAETDIVISGVGRVERAGGPPAKPGERAVDRPVVTFTFRAMRTSSGAVLAAEDKSLEIPDDKWITEAAFDKVADDIVGSLAAQMVASWNPPSRLTVTVRNAPSPREVSFLMTAFKEQLPSVTSVNFESHEAGGGTGVGVFSLEYGSTYEELLAKITELSNGKLPFDLEAGDNRRDTMTISIKKGS